VPLEALRDRVVVKSQHMTNPRARREVRNRHAIVERQERQAERRALLDRIDDRERRDGDPETAGEA
jgi:hypothetical protein